MLTNLFTRFGRDRRGNIAPMFAIALIPVIGLTGAAVDYARANKARTAIQSALDATMLAMSSQASSLGADALQTAASTYFNSVFTAKGLVPSFNFSATYTNVSGVGPRLTASVDSNVKTNFLGVLGINSVKVATSSTVAWGMSRLRVALALDNTGSMEDNGKMDALKVAAKSLLDQLKAAAAVDGDVYVSIVPFAKDVNVGAGNYEATWLKWGDWEDDNGSWTGCNQWGNNCDWTPANHNTWNGCVKDRNQDHDVKNTTPTSSSSTKFPAEQHSSCPVALMPLTYDWTALKAKIDAMQPKGNTNTTIGLAWAWQTLSSGAPFPAPAEDPLYQYTKVIIFLTDGDNTQNRWTTDEDDIDDRMEKACTNAKTAGIQIYTILVIQGNATLLKNCASDPDKYFKITASNQIGNVFTAIGTKLSKLRVAK